MGHVRDGGEEWGVLGCPISILSCGQEGTRGDSDTVTSQHITANTARYITGLSKVTVRSWGQRINIIARNLQYEMQ